MAAYWVMDVSYAFDNFKLDETLHAIVGKGPSGSGAGFGLRDIDWTFDNAEEAETVATKLRAYATEHQLGMAVTVSMHFDEE